MFIVENLKNIEKHLEKEKNHSYIYLEIPLTFWIHILTTFFFKQFLYTWRQAYIYF